MQPYFFPYIGYFQLINASNFFVFYDDVNYIKGGWINRNRILVNSVPYMFTVPLVGSSSNKFINELELQQSLNWKQKFLKSLFQNYNKAPFFNDVFKLIESVFNKNSVLISDLAILSIETVIEYLELNVQTYISSKDFPETLGLDRSDRLIEITKKLNSVHYVNPVGGISLYDKEYFQINGIKLNFLVSNIDSYNQFNNSFVGGLSIIDVLMFNDKESVRKMLFNSEII